VIITGYASKHLAAEAMKNRAYDFIKKPFADIDQIPGTVRKALEKRQMARQNARLTQELAGRTRLLREKLTQLHLMYELNYGIRHALDCEKLSSYLLDLYLSWAAVEACSFLLMRTNPAILFVKSRDAMSEEALATMKVIAVGEAERLARGRFRAEAVQLRYDRPPGQSEGQREKLPAHIGASKSAAVKVAGEVAGILTAFRLGAREFSPGDLRLLSLLTAQASRIVEGVRQSLAVHRAGGASAQAPQTNGQTPASAPPGRLRKGHGQGGPERAGRKTVHPERSSPPGRGR